MPTNVTTVVGATPVDFYLGNYSYANIVSGMGILRFKLDTAGTNAIFYKNAAGDLFKLMKDGMADGSLTESHVLFADEDGAAIGNSGFAYDGANVGLGATPASGTRLSIAGGNMQLIHLDDSPQFSIGDSMSAGDYGFIRWDSGNDLLCLGTQASGDVISIDEDGNIMLEKSVSSDDPLELYVYTLRAGESSDGNDLFKLSAFGKDDYENAERFAQIRMSIAENEDGNESGSISLVVAKHGDEDGQTLEVAEGRCNSHNANFSSVDVLQMTNESVSTISPGLSVGVISIVFAHTPDGADVHNSILVYDLDNSLVAVTAQNDAALNVTTGELTGTTGAEHYMTVSVYNGLIYIENQLGHTVGIRYTLL